MFIDIDYIELNNVSFDFKMLYCTMQKIFFKLKIIISKPIQELNFSSVYDLNWKDEYLNSQDGFSVSLCYYFLVRKEEEGVEADLGMQLSA